MIGKCTAMHADCIHIDQVKHWPGNHSHTIQETRHQGDFLEASTSVVSTLAARLTIFLGLCSHAIYPYKSAARLTCAHLAY